MNVDEIALRVADRLEPRGRTYSPDHYIEFAHALLAELSKDAAPVIASEQKPVAWVDVIDRHEGPYNFNGLELLDSGKHLLFTSPPNTADIEQRVAEACANVLERLAWRVKPASANEVAEELRSGKWREYP